MKTQTEDLTINSGFDVEEVRKDFPVLQQQVNGHPLVYLDNGATAQKPKKVIDCISHYYQSYNANIHRGVHHLSQLATQAYEAAREEVRDFLNAAETAEIVFTSGTTDGINLVANTYGRMLLKPGDEVLISAMEHHANIVPWQMVCEQTGAILKVIPISQKGEWIMDEALNMITNSTKIVAVMHVSNALGTINPVEQIIDAAHAAGARVLIDGAQAVPHFPVNIQQLNCDFYVFSGHKISAPTGIGILYGKKELMEIMPPWKGGGDMIKEVSFAKTTYAETPLKFEAGTPNIEGAIALAEGIRYWRKLNHEGLMMHEQGLLEYATSELLKIPGMRIYGTAERKVPVVSFLIEGLHPYDIGFILDRNGIAVRTGHHCAQPLMDFFKIPGTVRASFAFYNTLQEVDLLIKALRQAIRMLS
jgi:cysteine desulfurase/selenocysteine lyase